MSNTKPDSFSCGPFEISRRPDVLQFVEKLNRLREAVDACRIQPGVGYDVQRSTNGTTLSITSTRGTLAAAPEYPFKLSVKKKANSFQFYVNQGIVGNNDVPIDNIQTWIDFEPNALIYLEATMDNDMNIAALTLKSQKAEVELVRTKIDNDKQTVARISIGFYVPTEPTKKDYRIIQNVTTNIMTPLFCFNGYPALALTQESLSGYYS